MAKRRRIHARKKEIHLPLPVIQHIQSFLTGKQAARTTLVSKSWYNAWLTRPDLYFSEASFKGWQHFGFWDFVGETMQRYEELNLSINSFELRVSCCSFFASEVAHELIKQAVKLCVDGTDFKLKFRKPDFVLPAEVLETEKIVRLSVFGCKVDRPVSGKVGCSRLKSLRLERMHINDDLFLNTFPCMEDLILVCCHGFKELEISSTSLKCITVERRNFRAKFDVPNIRKFIFSGLSFPSLSLTECSREWKSEISIKHLHHRTGQVWFRNLKDLLRGLSLSMCKVYLSIGFYAYDCDLSWGGGMLLQNKPEVENLMLNLPSQFYKYNEFVGKVFMICHPKSITQYWFPKSCVEEKANNKLIKCLYKRLIEHMSGDVVWNSLAGLQEVNVEIFEETIGEWRPLQWKTLLNGSYCPEKKQKIRFLLQWG